MKVKLNRYQDEFIFSENRFPALITGIGTGKTFALLLKIWMFCEKYKDSLALLVRKEFTDLRDSTMNDFEKYFNVKIGSDKNFTFPNGSRVLFRHGAELNVLKNLNLSIIGIEQAEEFDNENTFDFLRDRLRRQTSPYRQLCIIANARGHNWCWQRWIRSADNVNVIDQDSNTKHYSAGDYEAWTASSFANEHNLPEDFVSDLRKMETDCPNHYKQYVLNSFEETEEDDYLFSFQEIEKSLKQEFPYNRNNYDKCILAADLARYGNDKCVAVILQQVGPDHWDEVYFETWGRKDLMHSVGRIMTVRAKYNPIITVLDGDGLGSGAVDRLRENGVSVVEYRSGFKPSAKNKEVFSDKKTESYMKVKQLIAEGKLKITEEAGVDLQTIRYTYTSKGLKRLVSKEKMKSDGVNSPDHGDAISMGVSEIDNAGALNDMGYGNLQRYAIGNNPYKGMR